MSNASVGFVGVGLMGSGMAKNILRKGFQLTVLAHRNRTPIEALVALGAHEAADLAELARRCDIVVLCVTGSPQVEAVAAGLAAAGKPLLVIDCSTSDPSSTTRLAGELAGKGVTLIDAPLSRTPADAEAGTLDVMAGGDDAAFEQARPVLETFAARIVRTGPVGSAHTAKLLNNFVALGYATLYAEALALGAKAGLTPQVFDAVLRNGRMDCGFYQTYFKYVLEGDRNAHRFSLSNAFKDLTYLSAFANAAGAVNPVGAAVRNTYAAAVATGHGADFVPMISDIVAEQNGLPRVHEA
ncbi:MAG: NAD(P)-dependent oxidoreductase [Rhizobiaceae bacterium]|nr:NAD(P)-dependent oxidoreductase [Rhizobiaceae bacterium]